ncbi:uncharacterized protein LOC117112358 [Anneissia japonica]|uniref:uncharacterized protein LOC117112358 n=1 Tax=Anneissia japonica TaxID=1529436 RepID=UPI00142556BE|nr:uncharacterized protein LOC117112358 [Anneissia japonica]
METLLKSAKLCIITTCLLQIHLTYAITVTPLDPIIAVGSDVNITCTLDSSETASYTAVDIIWEKDLVVLDSSLVNVLSDSEAMISLQNLTRAEHAAAYYCHLPNVLNFWEYDGTELHVGCKFSLRMIWFFFDDLINIY